MNSEAFCTLRLQNLVGFDNLLLGHAVFCLAGASHDLGAYTEVSAGIETAADSLRNVAYGLFEEVDMSEIVKIDDGT